MPNELTKPDYATTYELATHLEGAVVLPKHVRSKADAVAIMLTGQELGLQPMQSLRCLHLVEGRVELSSHLMLSLMASRMGVEFSWRTSTATEATLVLKRPDQPEHVETFSMQDAKRAGLDRRQTWTRWPKQMLRARCISNAARAYCPEILAGVYVRGEITDEIREAEERSGGDRSEPPVVVDVDVRPAPGPSMVDEPLRRSCASSQPGEAFQKRQLWDHVCGHTEEARGALRRRWFATGEIHGVGGLEDDARHDLQAAGLGFSSFGAATPKELASALWRFREDGDDLDAAIRNHLTKE